MKRLNKKGFTLVELLAVIVILALLMVVATRTIGNTLTNSRTEAMKTEASKIVSKTYEDLQSAALLVGTTTYTYAGVNTATGATEGNYTIIIGVNGYEMNSVCVDDGSKYTLGTVVGANITFTNTYEDGTCALSTVSGTNTAVKASS